VSALTVADLVVPGPVAAGSDRPVGQLSIGRLEVAAGEIVALVGPAGSGKTLLVRALCGLAPARGTVVVAGRALHGLPPYRRARYGLACVPAHWDGPDGLVAGELLDLAGRGRSRRVPGRTADGGPGTPWSHDALEACLPGLQRVLGATPASLGGWERAALGLAVALRTGPYVLLLDEPTAGLGDVTLARLGRALHQVAGTGVAVVVLTRHAAFARALGGRQGLLGAGRPGAVPDAAGASQPVTHPGSGEVSR